MKKLFSVILAILVPVLMFTACSKEKPAAVTHSKAEVNNGTLSSGVYYLVNDESRAVQIQIRDGNKIAIQYKSKTITESGKYTVEGDVLHTNIDKNGCEYVFNIKDGALFYDAAASLPSNTFVKESTVTDGAKFYLDHGFEAR